MVPLLFATALALASPTQQPLGSAVQPFILKDLRALPPGAVLSPDLQKQLYAGQLCKKPMLKTLGPDGSTIKKLGDLPPGLEEHAVLRMVNGCPVREIVYAGQTYYLDASPGALERLDPVSRVTKAPVENH
jgi:hypothetical protein